MTRCIWPANTRFLCLYPILFGASDQCWRSIACARESKSQCNVTHAIRLVIFAFANTIGMPIHQSSLRDREVLVCKGLGKGLAQALADIRA